MNLATVVMCWNIPRISEELMYELFCSAGPIEDISFGRTGKSCFIVFEHEEAVKTAKEIFKDIKLQNRPLRIFDYEEILKIYSFQEESAALNTTHRYDHVPNNFRGKPNDSRSHVYESRSFRSDFDRNSSQSYDKGRHFDFNRQDSTSINASPSRFHMTNDDITNETYRSSSMRSSTKSSNSYQYRPDLLPSSSGQSTKKRSAESDDGISNMNDSNDFSEMFPNPYQMPISRNPKSFNRGRNQSQPDHVDYDIDVPPGVSSADFMKAKWEAESNFARRNADYRHSNHSFPYNDSKSNPSNSRKANDEGYDPIQEYNMSRSLEEVKAGDNKNQNDDYRSSRYRNSSSNSRHPDRKSYHPRGSKCHDLPPPEADYMSRNSFSNERYRHRQNSNNWSRRH